MYLIVKLCTWNEPIEPRVIYKLGSFSSFLINIRTSHLYLEGEKYISINTQTKQYFTLGYLNTIYFVQHNIEIKCELT